MASSTFSPLRSSKALVATVVPIFTLSTSEALTCSSGFSPSRCRMPATAASRYCSGFSDSSLCVTSEKLPSAFGRRPTTSVNVPPRSIQKSHVSSCRAPSIRFAVLYLVRLNKAPGGGDQASQTARRRIAVAPQ